MRRCQEGKKRAFRARGIHSALLGSALILSFVVLMACPLPARGQAGAPVGQDVPPTHWAYAAIQDLARKGLIQGYPPDGDFLGGRAITRYEMAALLKRVVDRMEALLQSGSAAERQTLQGSAGQIRELVNQFKLELTVIGTDMEKVKADLSQLKTQIGQQQNQIQALTQRVDAAAMAADQARTGLEAFQSQVNAALAKKVDVATGRLRISGLIQIWYIAANGDAPNGNIPAPASAGPAAALFAGRSFGSGVGDTFRLRRGELALIGNITPRVDYRAMFDLAKTGTGSANVLQDLWVGFQIGPRLRIEAGQQKTGLSEEGTRSSAQLLTVERAIMNGLPPTVGRIGDIRDTGAVLKYQSAQGSLWLGIWNDNGAAQNVVDIDRQKFLSYTAYFTGIRHLTLGLWGGTNVGSSRPAPARDRFGGTLLWQSGPHFFEVEGAYTRDYAAGGTAGTIGLGGYALYAHALSSQWQLVGRFDYWDPAYQGGNFAGSATTVTGVVIPRSAHSLREYTFGVNYYLLKNNAKIQLNYIHEDPDENGITFFGKRRNLVIANYQAAF